MKYKHPSYIYDWKNRKSFPYAGINDPKYIRDRSELFKRTGNGWWWYAGVMSRKEYEKHVGLNG
jgi:hypothetical protein